MSLVSPYLGYENKETIDNLVIYEEQNGRHNIHFSEIKTTARNLLTDLTIEKCQERI
jgi:hypothetical protein